jgi:hypothetical protein
VPSAISLSTAIAVVDRCAPAHTAAAALSRQRHPAARPGQPGGATAGGRHPASRFAAVKKKTPTPILLLSLLISARALAAEEVTPPPAVATTPPVPAEGESWTRHLTVGGGAILWYYEPFLDNTRNNVELFFANIVLDARLGRFAFHAEPRLRNRSLRPFFAGPAWMQEVYGSAHFGDDDRSLVVKLGKEYSHFGLFWDDSFYGNVQVYDGLKLDPDYGLSLEGIYGERRERGVRAWAQYFVVDGGTNVSLPGRDTIGVADDKGSYPFRRRNHLIGRLEPFARPGGDTLIKLGLSGSYLVADLPVIGSDQVLRGAVDVTVTRGGLTLWGEVLRQNGQSVASFPVAGAASRHNDYALGGGEYTRGIVTARYVFSYGNYHDVAVKETMHVPALGVALDPGLSLLAELVVWQRLLPSGGATFVDRSLNVTLYGHF